MANKPKVNKSSPGVPAGSKPKAGNRSYDIFSPKNEYKNYDFPNMFVEQTAKVNNAQLRFSLECNKTKFQAHLDPTHLTDDQGKRIVQLDTLTGIVLQDYGYTAQNIELRGSTGAKYYQKILEMDNVFNNQSTSGNPTICTLIIEGRTYSGVWKAFTFDRIAQENTYKYVIGFTVMKQGKFYDNIANNFNSTQISSGTLKNAIESKDGKSNVKYVPDVGQTATKYVTGEKTISASKRKQALAYIATHWKDFKGNKARQYPGDNAAIKKGEALVVPIDWSKVLK